MADCAVWISPADSFHLKQESENKIEHSQIGITESSIICYFYGSDVIEKCPEVLSSV